MALYLSPIRSRINPMPIDELRQKLRPPCPALDVHVHPVDGIGPYTVTSTAEDADFLLAAARRCGVERMCLFSLDRSMAYEPSAELCRQANDYALRLRDRAPEVFLTFAYVTPAYPEKAIDEVRRCVEAEAMVGKTMPLLSSFFHPTKSEIRIVGCS